MKPPPSGYILVAALWLMLAISVAAAECAFVAHSHRVAAIAAADRARALGRVRAGMEEVLYLLTNAAAGGSVDPWRQLSLSSPRALGVGSSDEPEYTVTITDAESGLHVNVADSSSLVALFREAGLPTVQAELIARRIIAARSHDVRVTGSSPKPDMSEVPGLVGGIIDSWAELRIVTGVTESELSLIVPHLSLSGHGRININTATVPALVTLPAVTPDVAATIVSAQQSGVRFASVFQMADGLPERLRQPLLSALPTLVAATSVKTTVVIVRVSDKPSNSDAPLSLEATVELRGSVVDVVQKRVR